MHGQKAQKVPTFGYDANSDAIAAIADGWRAVSQHPDVRELPDSPPAPQLLTALISTPARESADDAGNKIDSRTTNCLQAAFLLRSQPYSYR